MSSHLVSLGAIIVTLFAWSAGPGATIAQGDADEEAVALISRQYPGFRLAAPSDFWPKLTGKDRGQIAIQTDLDGDGRTDAVVLVVNSDLMEYRIYLALGGQNSLRLLMSRTWTKDSAGHPVRTPMFLKRSGESGLSNQSYSPLNKSETRTYVSVPSIEVWSGQNHDERDRELHDLAYCSTAWYYDRSQLKHFEVCD